jgi:hypothetical protein
MRIQRNKVHLYHLSEINHDGRTFRPRLPHSMSDDPEYEDQKTRRVCFSSSLSGAFRAINDCGYTERLYVHIPVNIDEIIKNGKLIKPNEQDVYDVYNTGEYWIRQNTKLKCIGLAEFCYNENTNPWDLTKPDRNRVRIKWIEKYATSKKDN